ncbi:Kinesin light chain [Fusarium oxysporum f. sp. albedinis]|nr:Kinesin light chain [Fusarium oxysporum f. sp. albedinis]
MPVRDAPVHQWLSSVKLRPSCSPRAANETLIMKLLINATAIDAIFLVLEGLQCFNQPVMFPKGRVSDK